MRYRNYILFFVLFFTFFEFVSCKKDFYASSISDTITLSNDTVAFDTIFTQKGSITQSVQIKTERDGIIKINKIYLEKASNSEFFINVNGIQGPSIENIEIESGDSIFVFIQTKLNEQNADTAIYHEEHIIIDYNSTQSKIIVTAWGQNVINYKGASIGTTTFTNKKPYVIYDSLIVKSGETLTIEAGAKIYLHYNANIIIYGSLKIQGNLDNPVTFSSDRLESTYQQLPGQWGSIIFKPTSNNNEISYSIIKNGINGLVFYGNTENSISCNINNSQISNMSGNCIFAQNANIKSYNCIFTNSDYYILKIEGGRLDFTHNTIYNAGTVNGRKYYPSIYISDYFSEDSTNIALEQTYFYNSIIIGTMSNEIVFSTLNANNSLNAKFKSCLLRDTYTNVDSIYYDSNTFYASEKTLFSNNSYILDTLSQARNIGNIEYGNLYPNDLLNHSRIIDSAPDAGALEYYYEKE